MVSQEMVSLNCEVCGNEEFEKDLQTIKLSSFNRTLNICKECYSNTPEELLKGAAQLLLEISALAEKKTDNPEQRIKEIKKMLGIDVYI